MSSVSYTRTNQLASRGKEFDFKFFVFNEEVRYKPWWSFKRLFTSYHQLADSTRWNCLISVMALVAVVLVAVDMRCPIESAFETFYNLLYGFHSIVLCYLECSDISTRTCMNVVGYILDILSYFHYVASFLLTRNVLVTSQAIYLDIKIICYYFRMHRPIRFLWSLSDANPMRSVLGTMLKYVYVFCFLRISFAIFWVELLQYEGTLQSVLNASRSKAEEAGLGQHYLDNEFLWGLYAVDKMFLPIGPQNVPMNDVERLACLTIIITGTLAVTGVAVATMAIVLSVYLKHEEAFRARFKLIIRDMTETRMPMELQHKVETFYRMYWHKQGGVSDSQLLRTFPPSLSNFIVSEIYFEAQQKSRVLRDLSSQFLSETAKVMSTIYFIPGDPIIARNSTKSAIIYVTYGDVEMLTAEDDITPILRFCRGTILNGCGGCPPAACARSHVKIRAATYCIAHVLRTADLWKIIAKYGRNNSQAFIIHSAFEEHLKNVMNHYEQRHHMFVRHKSSILLFKRNLVDLKEARDANGRLLLERSDVFLDIAGCYIMRNRADLSLIEEGDEICLRSTFPCILQPTSSVQTVWNGFVAVIIFIISLTHPYFCVHVKTIPPAFHFFDYVVTVIFILDIIAHLSTGDKIEEGVPISFKQTSTQQMKSLWFALDVLSTLPMLEFVGDGHFAGLNKLLKLPKLFRALKSMEEVAVYHSNVLRFLAYTLLILIATYLIACLQQGFMCFQFDYCEVTDLAKSPFWSKTPLNEENVKQRLFVGLYWALCMVNFTSHKTVNWAVGAWQVRLFTMVVLEICMLLCIFVEAVYSATIMVTLNMRQEYETCIADVKNFLIRNNVDPLLRNRFVNYLQLCWHTDRAYSITHKKQSVLYDLPKHVSDELLAMQRSKYMLCIPFMKYLHAKDLTDVSSSARLFYTSPNEILLRTGDISNEMYVIKQGMCEVLNPITKKVVSIITTRNHFGMLECVLRIPAFYTVRAVTHVQVLSISSRSLNMVINLPRIKDAIDYAKLQQEYIRLLEPREAFIKYEPLPLAPNRSFFPMPRKYEVDMNFLVPFQRLGFLSVLRYVFPRWTIRPDGTYMKRYEWFRVFCALLTSFIFPCYTYMVLQFPSLVYFYYFLDYTAYYDIIQRMLVGYYDEQGILVYHPASTAAHYLKGAFLADFCAALPMELLDKGRSKMYETDPVTGTYRVAATVQHLMFNRLLQLYRLPSALNSLSVYIGREDILLVIKGLPMFMALLNAMTSSVIFDTGSFYSPIDGGKPYFRILNGTHKSWILQKSGIFRFNVTDTPWNFYLAGLFWVVYETTTTGFNLFNPNSVELTQTIYLGCIVGSMLTTYFSVRVISIRANVNKALAAFQDHMRDMTRYMRQEKLSLELQKEVYEYYTYSWDKMGGNDYRSIIKLCDQITLRTDAILHIYGETFRKCPVLQEDLSLLRLVGRSVHSVYLVRRSKLIERDDVIAQMYFVDFGSIEIRDPDNDSTVVSVLGRGSIFGNLDEVSTLRCPNSFVARTNVHLLMLNTLKFYRITQDFPSVKMNLDFYRPRNENFIVGSDGYESNISYSIKKPLGMDLKTGLLHFIPQKGIAKYFEAHSKLMHVYLIFISTTVCYLDIYNATFQHNSTLMLISLYILDLCFYLKIVLQYVLPSTYKDDEARHFMFLARKMYFRTHLKYDLASCIPIELFGFLASKDNQWSWFAILRLNRVLRVMTIRECLKRHHEKLHVNLVCSTLISVTIWFTIFIHATTCIFYYIGVMVDRKNPGTSWRNAGPNDTVCGNRYFCSLYFIITTFTHDGIGDILPRVQVEIVFVCLLQIVSTMQYMIYVGEFSNIIQYQSFRSFKYYMKYVELQAFLKCNRVAKNLVALVNKYALHLWRESRGLQTPKFLEIAPQCLRAKIMSAAYLKHLKAHSVFKTCEPAFLRQLVLHFKIYTYNAGMFVVKESEITDAMYVIHRGYVEKIAEDIDETLRVYRTGECFGSGLHRDTPYNYSYRVMGNAKVLTLCLRDWEYLLAHFPDSKQSIAKEMGYNDDDKPPDNKKRVILQKAMGRARETKMNVPDRGKRFVPISKLRRATKSTTSLARVKSGTPKDILSKESSQFFKEEVMESETDLDLDNLSRLFPMDSRHMSSAVDFREIEPVETETPQPAEIQEQRLKTQSVKPSTIEHDTKLFLEEGTSKIADFLGGLAPSFEKFLTTAVSHWKNETSAGPSQVSEQTSISGDVKLQIDESDDGELKSIDIQKTSPVPSFIINDVPNRGAENEAKDSILEKVLENLEVKIKVDEAEIPENPHEKVEETFKGEYTTVEVKDTKEEMPLGSLTGEDIRQEKADEAQETGTSKENKNLDTATVGSEENIKDDAVNDKKHSDDEKPSEDK